MDGSVHFSNRPASPPHSKDRESIRRKQLTRYEALLAMQDANHQLGKNLQQLGLMGQAWTAAAHMLNPFLQLNPLTSSATLNAVPDWLRGTGGMMEFFTEQTRQSPLDITETKIDGGGTVPVQVKSVLAPTPFWELLHLEKQMSCEDEPRGPKILLLPAYAVHGTEYYKRTAQALLPWADVYILDVKDAREVVKRHGDWDVDDHTDAVIECHKFIGKYGDPIHDVVICGAFLSSTAARIKLEGTPYAPKTMTYIAIPGDMKNYPSELSDCCQQYTLAEIEENLLSIIPAGRGIPGEGRTVLAGLTVYPWLWNSAKEANEKGVAFLTRELAHGWDAPHSAGFEKTRLFYVDDKKVIDIHGPLYLQHIQRNFQGSWFPNDRYMYRGTEHLRLKDITGTNACVMVGLKDVVCLPMHSIGLLYHLTGLPLKMRDPNTNVLVLQNSGHMGAFSSSEFDGEGVSFLKQVILPFYNPPARIVQVPRVYSFGKGFGVLAISAL